MIFEWYFKMLNLTSDIVENIIKAMIEKLV